jgi:F-type H+-transporting ATPase subunit gamma
MPESLVNTKRRITTIRSTEKITKAMKLVASVKYQRWKKYFEENKAYITGMNQTMLRTLAGVDFYEAGKPNILTSYNKDKTLYIVVTSTLGLCGAYNYNLFKALDPVLKQQDELFFIGTKGLSHYNNKDFKKHTDYVDLLDNFTYSAVRRMRHQIVRLYKSQNYSKVVLVYTKYVNSLTFTPVLHQLLPLDPKLEGVDEVKKSLNPPIFEPNVQSVLEQILPHYIDASLYHKLIESELSELASRRNAMETDTDAADKIQAQLQLEYNKARQNAITQEITEVVAGANAGKKKE